MESFTITSKKVLTLVLVIDKAEQKVLLGYKKRGFGAHLWNGFGGKVEPGETTREGALRELEEEAGITVKTEDFKKAGILLFQFENDPVALETHVYKSYEYQGLIRECEEMRPQWFAFADVPYDQMWEDDRIWLPMLLNGQDPFYGRMYFKRKPVEDTKEIETTVTSVVNTSTSTHVNHSTTMTGTSFTTAQPKSGPFAMCDYQLEHSLQGVPREIALDGTIASFEN
ncbi:Nudix (Nucleoside diphosphate linked moiety X)-type motif 1 [Linnemannia schmuckeri]|uniref:Oxidized purine nucleoside triphosphate hydrolase n=1 Tax=Linnemannia schmuckeri TaxID=64567 RepID=A0A9P5S0Q6_9FUNG|nr:Nudix (Nucleoside diphosphate linked moiety X)-type motif 1 [Linnemannia schmuckeri]